MQKGGRQGDKLASAAAAAGEKNRARSQYNRPTGQVGLHIDVYSAKADTTKTFGSEQFFLMSLTDKLFDVFKENVSMDKVKGAFERKELFDDVIMEGFHRGVNITLSLGFNNPRALDAVHDTYKSGVVGDIIQNQLVDQFVLKKVDAKEVTLRCTMYDDELSVCRDEILNGEVTASTKEQIENFKQMVDLTKEYQKKMTSDILCLKDEFFKAEACLGELLFTFKSKPKLLQDVDQISTYNQFLTLTKKLMDLKDVNPKPINQFKKTIKMAANLLNDIRGNLCDRLMQIHDALETENQTKRKRYIRSATLDALKKLDPEYNLVGLKHYVWQEKILRQEEKMFLGFVSLLPCVMDIINDIDQNLDEYMSAVSL